MLVLGWVQGEFDRLDTIGNGSVLFDDFVLWVGDTRDKRRQQKRIEAMAAEIEERKRLREMQRGGDSW